ncbi:nitroreductase family deazaflavin-dependent oxidoreductase [Jatrophihabitans cynanchi]|uniref:Nitroreductase family deazaflavin-dependent oxidoreductase n=2 Tax=Jatrophihabitans cynanchi TaxID=2944128 RepID=A0ABY7JZ54_9ACTN|nr:nitroreductase family deazaflavin-dependent oxidoreductase [Jatrophihabitans sp. SB3-54]WAX57851.1 nitroreductase family deazaflavin-dependent oxidoreductase [Jatrophihabitans sp. SB3-54]
MKAKPKGLDRPSTVKIIKAMSTAHTWLYRRSGGRLGRKWHVGSALRHGVPVCLLTTTGRKSGVPRTVPLLYLADGEDAVLVASQGGLPTNPQWYYNLLAEPAVTVQLGTRTRAMRARVADAAERAVLWPRLVRLYADYENYQSWTDREIPVIICEPVR